MKRRYKGMDLSDVSYNISKRRELFEMLLQHILKGFSRDCFEFLSLGTIEEYCKLYPKEFDVQLLENATRKAKSGWEEIGREQALGKCLGNSRSWFYNMAHRYGWSDKVQVDANVKGNVNVSVVNYGIAKAPDDAS